MASKQIVTLPDEWIERSWALGRQVVADYAGGRNANSRAVSCFDAEKNINLQAVAKMSECAFALWAGLDPATAIHWARWCDDGADVMWRGMRCDVKATNMGNRFLIWPIGKNEIFDTKKFDALVLVKQDWPVFEIAGWATKAYFKGSHKVAGEGHKLFPGTRYLSDNELYPMEYDPVRDFWGSVDDYRTAIRASK